MPAFVLAILAGLAVCQLAMLFTTVYLHRALAHRSLQLRPVVAMGCRTILWITTGITARQWVAVHRKHHAHTDVDGDPHSPVLRGYRAVQFGNVAMYRKVANDPATVARYARDLPPDRWDRLLFDHALFGLSIGIGFLCITLGWRFGLLAAGIHTVTYLVLNAAVNAVGHRFGRRPYRGFATNSQWLAWMTMGEGLHNNHHAAPTSANLALARHEFDPAWPAIDIGRRLGWLTVRHPVARMAVHDAEPKKVAA
ncbi:MAG: fatty acid desaturase [Actinomycetota bacterium]|nr:fatty acid desaturase [Actinomycetota bacterium]